MIQSVVVHKEEIMARPAPQTRYWKAREDRQPGPGRKGVALIVTGEVEVGNTNETPHLAEHQPQGFNPKILLLDLSITASGVGNPVLTWKPVRFEKQVERDQHSEVDILWEGNIIARVEVEIVQ
jgi:hypothetical protein